MSGPQEGRLTDTLMNSGEERRSWVLSTAPVGGSSSEEPKDQWCGQPLRFRSALGPDVQSSSELSLYHSFSKVLPHPLGPKKRNCWPAADC